MRNISFIVFMLLSVYGISQTIPANLRPGRTYISIKHFKEFTGKNISKKDSLLFVIRELDTLVPLPEDYDSTKGVSVLYEPKDSIFLEIYKDIVYRKHQKVSAESIQKTKMRYWKNTVNIYFDKSVDVNAKNELTKFANYLSNNVDSLTIKFVENKEDSNYLIYSYKSENDFKYDERIKGNKNDYYLNWDKNQRIIKCNLQLNSTLFENNEDFILKSKKLFLHTLGRFSSTNLVGFTNYFSTYNYKNQEFSSIDLELLKYHYSYGICKGTDLESFEDQHKRAQEQIKQGIPMYFTHVN